MSAIEKQQEQQLRMQREQMELFGEHSQDDIDGNSLLTALTALTNSDGASGDSSAAVVASPPHSHPPPPRRVSFTPPPLPPSSPTTAISVAPLKVSVFIDGTWLYYSCYGRGHQSTIQRLLGDSWMTTHEIDWSVIPNIIVDGVRAQLNGHQWQDGSLSFRPIEVTHTRVFTSMKASTNADSFRSKMFADMAKANFDVHMMETEGEQEKCIDIQLAVDMLHYATVPDAYDIAVILTGDKDFMPAMMRTREKGKRVILASMRKGCNIALQKPTSHTRDYDIIWLDDVAVLNRLVAPLAGNSGKMSAVFVLEMISRFLSSMKERGVEWVTSRALGRFLKGLKVTGATGGDVEVLTQVKTTFGGLRNFMNTYAHVFNLTADGTFEEFAFNVAMTTSTKERIAAMQDKMAVSDWEKAFLDAHVISDAVVTEAFNFEKRARVGWELQQQSTQAVEMTATSSATAPPLSPLSDKTAVELKSMCKDAGLMVGGNKAQLITRLQGHSQPAARLATTHPYATKASEEHLLGCIKELLTASGNRIGSRDVGRHLAACPSSAPVSKSGIPNVKLDTAQKEMKRHFGSLTRFLDGLADIIEIEEDESGEHGEEERYYISLKS
jgi:hypothetical protein